MLLFIVAVSQSACGGDSKTLKTDSSKLQDPPEESTKKLTTDFPILFLRNYKTKVDSNQLELLMDQEFNNIKPKKVVFQFFHDSANNLTLLANAGKKNHKDFGFSYVPVLETSVKYPATKIDIAGKNVVLADQEISDDDKIHGVSVLDTLRSLKNKRNYEYITFSPRLDTLDNGKFYIRYELGYWKGSDFPVKTRVLPTMIIGLSLNPSPPRDGY